MTIPQGPTLTVQGIPLSELNLDKAVIRLKSGTIVPFAGFAVYNGQSILEAIQAAIPEDGALFLSREDAMKHCDHDWVEHHGPHGMTHRMCVTCGEEELVNPLSAHYTGAPQPVDPYAEYAELIKSNRQGVFERLTAWWKSRDEPFIGRHTILGVDDGSPYMTRRWIGRLRLHVFHRGDNDADPHDHPWNFWTFPLTSYIEEVTERFNHPPVDAQMYITRRQVVRAFRLHYRPATHTHRVISKAMRLETDMAFRIVKLADIPIIKLGRHSYVEDEGRIITLVWRGDGKRPWGFLKHRDGRWCWIAWKDYVFNGGKSAPCE